MGMTRILTLFLVTIFLVTSCAREEKLGVRLDELKQTAEDPAKEAAERPSHHAPPASATPVAPPGQEHTEATQKAASESVEVPKEKIDINLNVRVEKPHALETDPAQSATPPDVPAAPSSSRVRVGEKPAAPMLAARPSVSEPMGQPSESPAAPPAAKNGAGAEDLLARIDAYLGSLKTAAYTFNPPSPITVAKPVTIHLWLDPQATPEELAEELKKLVPRDAERVEAGETHWAPLMEATLKGDNFSITAITPGRQPVSSKSRTTWSWSVAPKQPGEKQPLYLTLNVVLPDDLGGLKTVKTFERQIDVDVTWWWMFDHYFEKYWKWLLGGLGAALASAIGWWWKRRHA